MLTMKPVVTGGVGNRPSLRSTARAGHVDLVFKITTLVIRYFVRACFVAIILLDNRGISLQLVSLVGCRGVGASRHIGVGGGV